MLKSIEIRWFFSNDLPEKILNFCREKNLIKRYESRTDYYLIQMHDKIGIKLRANRLEIKYNTDSKTLNLFNNSVKGIAEKWTRVEWDDSNAHDNTTELLNTQSQLWDKIDKRRYQTRFKLNNNNQLEKVEDNAEYSNCAFEVTKLKTNNAKVWWSIAFDLFIKSDGDNYNRLEIFIEKLFSGFSSNDLNSENSYGYPKWLSIIRKDNNSN